MHRIPVKALREGFVPLHRPAAAQQTGQKKTQRTTENKSRDDSQNHREDLPSALILSSGFECQTEPIMKIPLRSLIFSSVGGEVFLFYCIGIFAGFLTL
jgi:hypothetical protein